MKSRKKKLKALDKIPPGAEFTALAHWVGLKAAYEHTPFDRVKIMVADAIVRKHGGSYTSVDEFLFMHMPKAREARVAKKLAMTKQARRDQKYGSKTRIPTPALPSVLLSRNDGFYESSEWKSLRYLALKTYGRSCSCCGASGCVIHVDHIRPRSRHPELQLDIRNTQPLCEPCNMGKSAWDETDWRTPEQRDAGNKAHGG